MPDLRRFHALALALVLGALISGLIVEPAWAKRASKSDMSNPKYASIVLDAETGKVLSSRYPDKIVHPASLTKMMTMYMVFREIEAGRMSLNQSITVSSHAASQPPSKVGLRAGSRIKVKDALGLVVTLSANDLATALGEAVSGSESKFARDMTNVAHAMGMNSTQFRNANGLPNSGQVTSAKDMAILARALLYHYPQHYHFFGIKNYSYNGKSYHNHNRLMNTFAGMDGIKTGFINDSGFNLVASAKRNNRRLIGVVFGGRSWQTRNSHMAELLNSGFDKIKYEQPVVTQVAYKTLDPILGQGAAPSTLSNAPASSPVAARVATAAPIARTTASASTIVSAPAQRLNEGMRTPAQQNPAATYANSWGIQVGAYSDQNLTLSVASRTAQTLGAKYGVQAQPIVVPFQSQNGLIYRARVGGLSQEQAVQACRTMTSCLVVQPNG